MNSLLHDNVPYSLDSVGLLTQYILFLIVFRKMCASYFFFQHCDRILDKKKLDKKSLFGVIVQGDTVRHGGEEQAAGVERGWLPCISSQEVETTERHGGISRKEQGRCQIL